MDIPNAVLEAYGLHNTISEVKTFGTGLINHTWKIEAAGKTYILQRINTQVFQEPKAIASNIQSVADYLNQHYPAYFFPPPLLTLDGKEMVYSDENGGSYYRIFLFVDASHSKDVVQDATQAYEAAAQFGKFTKLLSGFDITALKITLPDFHNLSLRYKQFQLALETGNRQRITESVSLISFIKVHVYIVTQYESIQNNSAFKKRVTHHDTKISNVLFNDDNKAICVIDLDTIMPGYFISDVGDMMRTYLSTVSEEERDFSKIEIRDDVYNAIVKGYGTEMGDELSTEERKYFFYAGTFMIYMQAIRFLTDHINDDIYYGAKYPGHNFVRAGNQVVLLQRLLEKREILK